MPNGGCSLFLHLTHPAGQENILFILFPFPSLERVDVLKNLFLLIFIHFWTELSVSRHSRMAFNSLLFCVVHSLHAVNTTINCRSLSYFHSLFLDTPSLLLSGPWKPLVHQSISSFSPSLHPFLHPFPLPSLSFIMDLYSSSILLFSHSFVWWCQSVSRLYRLPLQKLYFQPRYFFQTPDSYAALWTWYLYLVELASSPSTQSSAEPLSAYQQLYQISCVWLLHLSGILRPLYF